MFAEFRIMLGERLDTRNLDEKFGAIRKEKVQKLLCE